MKATGSFFAAVALTTAFAGVAGAQQPPEGEEPPQQSYEPPPPQGYPPQGQQYAPPPGYAPAPGSEAPPAAGPAAGGFGAVGQIAISSDLLVTAARTSQSVGGQSNTSTSLLLQPAIDYFVAPNLSIGGQVKLGVFSTDAGDQTTIGLLPRIAYNIPIGPTTSIWPRGSLGYIHYSNSYSGGGPSQSSYTVSFIAFVPILFQPAPHFFIGGGPYLSTDLISKIESTDGIKTTEFGLLSTLGGYFGGT